MFADFRKSLGSEACRDRVLLCRQRGELIVEVQSDGRNRSQFVSSQAELSL